MGLENDVKILIVSWFFPPSSTMGALRIGKLARFLTARGHEIRVVTVKNAPHAQTMAVEIDEQVVTRTPWIDVNRVSLSGLRRRIWPGKAGTAQMRTAGKAPAKDPTPRRRSGVLSKLYVQLTNWPDARVGWLPYAVRAGRVLASEWKPDIVFASGPPFTTLNAGYLIAKRHRLPLVCEFRDRWTDDTYWPPEGLHLAIEKLMERRVVDYACGLTTVSDPWAEAYRQRFGKPAITVLNGYDPKDYPDEPSPGARGDRFLRIGYTGSIYVERRDPTPLFQALQLMKATPDQVRVDFWGTRPNLVYPLAETCGVRDLVEVHPRVPNDESVRRQRASDVLLIMQWDNPRELGNVPGKLFEYLGARRPILGLGPLDGVPANIVRERQAGVYCNDPEALTGHLKNWVDAKRRDGEIPELPQSARQGFTRNEQYLGLEAFLEQCLAGRP